MVTTMTAERESWPHLLNSKDLLRRCGRRNRLTRLLLLLLLLNLLLPLQFLQELLGGLYLWLGVVLAIGTLVRLFGSALVGTVFILLGGAIVLLLFGVSRRVLGWIRSGGRLASGIRLGLHHLPGVLRHAGVGHLPVGLIYRSSFAAYTRGENDLCHRGWVG